jgi:hypothetical protein
MPGSLVTTPRLSNEQRSLARHRDPYSPLSDRLAVQRSRLGSGRSSRRDWPSTPVPGERLVSFLVSFMYVYLRSLPSTTAF